MLGGMIPAYVLPPTPEAFTQKAILDYLRSRGYVCWRNNTGGRPWNDKFGKSRVMTFGFKGSGDILGLTKEGRFFTIEVKRRGKKPTPEQIEFMDRILQSNGIAILAYSVDDVISRL